MKDKALAAIRQFDMIKTGDRIVAGVSGGADSVALLHFLRSIKDAFGITIIAAHLNHNLRGEESMRDERFVKDLCGKLGVTLITESLDIAALSKESGEGIEECARNSRYRFFSRITPEGGKIATAHTLSDSVETQLLNLVRGTGIRGLCGIPPVRGNIIRPLINCERREIEAYCAENDLDFIIDSSNLSNDYTRNRLRNQVIPVLTGINPAYLRCAGRSMELLRQDDGYIASLAEEWVESHEAAAGFSVSDYFGAPEALSGRILMRICAKHGVSCDFARAGLLRELILSGSGAVQLADGIYFKCSGGGFRIERKDRSPKPVSVRIDLNSLPENGIIEMNNGNFIKLSVIDASDFETSHKYCKTLLKNVMDCDKIDKILTLRTRLPGDRIKLSGRGCTKSVKKLFSESRLEPSARDRILMLSGGDGSIFWLQGFGVCEACRMTGDTKKILAVDVMEDINA